MRRGHAGIGGWRNENPRHFRPRGGGTPHFRPPRGYGLLDAPRYKDQLPSLTVLQVNYIASFCAPNAQSAT